MVTIELFALPPKLPLIMYRKYIEKYAMSLETAYQTPRTL